MKSRTSFFNLTVFRKNITRFSPVWALYTVFLLLVLFGISGQETDYMARDVIYITRLAGIGNLLYAGIVAMCLFGDLYKGRLCNALHAFPMRREGWLLTNIATGFLFSLIPNLLVCTLTSFQLGEHAPYIWYLFSAASLQYIFFFGTAVLSALCAGNKLGMLAVYSMIQFVVVLIYFLAELIYRPLIYGIELQTDKFFQFFPLARMYTEYVQTEFGMGSLVFEGFDTEAWTHLYICTAVGVVAFVLAWLVYRRRHLERAGDFIALRPLAPVFLTVYTIAVGAVLYSFSAMINQPSYVIYGIGIVIGFFTGQMLLGRTVRVFHKKSWLAFGVLVVMLSGSMALTWLDPMGIGSYVPPIDKVESAAIYGPDKNYYYYEEYEYDSFEMTDPEEIAKLQSYHKKLMDVRSATSNNYDVRIRYNLADGTEINRYYQVDFNSPLTEEAGIWFSDARYIFQVDDPEVLYSLFSAFNVDRHKTVPSVVRPTGAPTAEPTEKPTEDPTGTSAPTQESTVPTEGDFAAPTGAPETVPTQPSVIYDEIDNFFLQSKDPEELKGLLDAILADCAAGKMTQSWNFHDGYDSDYSVGFELNEAVLKEDYAKYRFRNLTIYGDCTNTIAYLDKLFAELPDDDNHRVG